MAAYEAFADRAEATWLPYLMYFHRTDYRSGVVNTDRLGFRRSTWRDGYVSVAARDGDGPVNVFVGSSTAFGVGATGDAATIPSRLAGHSALPWLNLGGRGYCSTQELLLFMLHRHLLPDVREIVVMSGLNDLVLAGLPEQLRSEYGGFFFCGDYYRQMAELKTVYRKKGRASKRSIVQPASGPELNADQRVGAAAEQIARNLDHWVALAEAVGTRLSFVVQPLATWVRQTPVAAERALFQELDSHETDFWRSLFGVTSHPDVGARYVDALAAACAKRQVRFLDLNAALAGSVGPDQWVFVDRAHFNDDGYDLVSRVLATELDLH
jgi:lysophospholipase L1-like esterase